MPAQYKSKFAKEIAIVLLIKVLLLTVIWALFVRGHEVKVDADSVSHSFGFHSQISDQMQGVHHD